MMDEVFVELVVAEIVFPGQQTESIGRRKGEEKPFRRTMRPIADDGDIEVGGDLLAHTPAMTSALIGLCRHGFLHFPESLG
jgi:hypothetical protein